MWPRPPVARGRPEQEGDADGGSDHHHVGDRRRVAVALELEPVLEPLEGERRGRLDGPAVGEPVDEVEGAERVDARKTAAKTIAGISSGSVRHERRWNQLAPSTEPASNTSCGSACRRAYTIDEDERRPLPGVDDHERPDGETAGRTASRCTRSPSLTATQLSSPHSGLRSARHISPTTIGVSSIGRIRIPRTIVAPRRCWLKKSASAVPSTTWIATPAVVSDQRVLDGIRRTRGSWKRSL